MISIRLLSKLGSYIEEKTSKTLALRISVFAAETLNASYATSTISYHLYLNVKDSQHWLFRPPILALASELVTDHTCPSHAACLRI